MRKSIGPLHSPDPTGGIGEKRRIAESPPPKLHRVVPSLKSTDLRLATPKEIVTEVFDRFQIRDSVLAGKLQVSKENGDTVSFSTNGSDSLSVWSSLWTDLTLKCLSDCLARKSASTYYRLSFRGESHITDSGIFWLCAALSRGDASRAKSITVELDIRQCPGLTQNSATKVLNTFGPKSLVHSDLPMTDQAASQVMLKPDTPATLCVSCLLFLTPSEIQFSPLRSVKECRLRPAVRGTVADSEFLSAGTQTKISAVELCLSAYNIQYFTSQPDQVVIAVENDFDAAVAHIAACLTNFVSRENPVLRRNKPTIESESKRPEAPKMPDLDRDPAKHGSSNLDSHWHSYSEFGCCMGGLVDQRWILPLDDSNGGFVSYSALKRGPGSRFSVIVQNCHHMCIIGVAAMPTEAFELESSADFEERFKTAGIAVRLFGSSDS